MSIADEPVFPTQRYLSKEGGGYLDLGDYMPVPEGLTKREHFAAMAMQGFAACQGVFEQWGHGKAALNAVQLADALLAELDKPREAKS